MFEAVPDINHWLFNVLYLLTFPMFPAKIILIQCKNGKFKSSFPDGGLAPAEIRNRESGLPSSAVQCSAVQCSAVQGAADRRLPSRTRY
jgi:hypothetical protein